MIIGRLAVDHGISRPRPLARGALRDALLRTLQAADIAGIRAILVHAISSDAQRFYERHGFVRSPIDPMMLMITLAEVERELLGPQAKMSETRFFCPGRTRFRNLHSLPVTSNLAAPPQNSSIHCPQQRK